MARYLGEVDMHPPDFENSTSLSRTAMMMSCLSRSGQANPISATARWITCLPASEYHLDQGYVLGPCNISTDNGVTYMPIYMAGMFAND